MCAFIWRWFLLSLSVAFKPAGAARQFVNMCCVPRRPTVLLFPHLASTQLLRYNSKCCKPSHVSRLSCCWHFYPPQKKTGRAWLFWYWICLQHLRTLIYLIYLDITILVSASLISYVVWGVVMSIKAIKRWKPVKKWSSYERMWCRMNRIVKIIHHHVWVHFKVSPSWEWDAAWKPLAASKKTSVLTLI